MTTFERTSQKINKGLNLLADIVIGLTTTTFVGIIGVSAVYGFYELVVNSF